MKTFQITLLKGDGIGPEIVDQAVKVLNKTAEKFDFAVTYDEALLGGGQSMPPARLCLRKQWRNARLPMLCFWGLLVVLKWDTFRRPAARGRFIGNPRCVGTVCQSAPSRHF